MSKYVEVKALEKAIIENAQDLRTLSTKTVGQAISSLPTIDIVRCYGCKHYKEEDVGVGIYQWCELLQREVEIDWYCASGERIEE